MFMSHRSKMIMYSENYFHIRFLYWNNENNQKNILKSDNFDSTSFICYLSIFHGHKTFLCITAVVLSSYWNLGSQWSRHFQSYFQKLRFIQCIQYILWVCLLCDYLKKIYSLQKKIIHHERPIKIFVCIPFTIFI